MLQFNGFNKEKKMNCLKNMYLDDKINQQMYIKRGLSVLQILIFGEGEQLCMTQVKTILIGLLPSPSHHPFK